MTDSIRPNHLDLADALRRFQDDFNRDFTLRDIASDLHKHLGKADFNEINGTNLEEEAKIERLFFFFIYVKKDVNALIKLLKNSYQWLHSSIIRSALRQDQWILDYRQAIQDIPKNQDWNIHRTEYLRKIQQQLKTLQRNNYLILFGKLGFGKRWLAA